jgi:hypothetical protein
MSILLTQQGAPADVTGNGSLVDSAATVAGAGISLSSGSGALASAAAILLAVGLSISTGSGALAAQAATLSGEGIVSDDTIAGAGALHAQSAQVAGVGLSASSGTGALAAQAATVSATGTIESTGTGALSAQASTLAATGITQWLAHSDDKYLQEDGVSRYLQEDAASFFLREEIALTPGAAQISGEGLVTGDVGGVVPAGKPARDVRRRYYIMPDGRMFEATTDEVLALLQLYAVPKEAIEQLSEAPKAQPVIRAPQITLRKRDVRFVPADQPNTYKAVISERFVYRAPPEAYGQAEILANRIRADEEAILALLM